MLRKKTLSLSLAVALAMPVCIVPMTNSYAYVDLKAQGILGYADIHQIDDITDEFIDEYKSKNITSISLTAPKKQDDETKYEDIRNIGRLKALDKVETLRIVSGTISKDSLKRLIKDLPKLKRLSIVTNDFMNLDDIVDNSIRGINPIEKVEVIEQAININTVFTNNIIENPAKIRGEYAKISSIEVVNTNQDIKAYVDVNDNSKIKIDKDKFNELVTNGPTKIKLEYAKTTFVKVNSNRENRIKDIEYIGELYLTIDKNFNVNVDGGRADKTEAKKGDIVGVTADKINAEGKIFEKWISDNNIDIKDSASLNTSFVMPRENVSLKAIYRECRPITSLKMTTDTILIPKNETTTNAQLYLEVDPIDNDDELRWESSNEGIATVDQNGKVTLTKKAKTDDEVDIIVKAVSKAEVSRGISAKLTLKVEQKDAEIEEQVKEEKEHKKHDNREENEKEDKPSTAPAGGGGGGGGSATPLKPNQEQVEKPQEQLAVETTEKVEEKLNKTLKTEQMKEREIEVSDVMSNKDATEKVNELKDVNEITWSRPYVEKVIQKAIMKGDKNGNFMPKKSVTRAEVAQVIANILGEKAQKQTQVKDVSFDKWYNDAVQTVLEKGIFVKDVQGKFNPENKITRAELFVVIAKLKGINELDEVQAKQVLSKYKDSSSVPAWARGYVAALVEKGIVKGSENMISPKDVLTREQLATMFAQIIK